MKAKTVLAWHFVKDDGTNRDGIKEKVGKWYRVEGEIVPCERGLHGSVRLLDALNYAPGVVLRRTEHQGTIVEHNGDKIASSERRALWQIDATKLLQFFACSVAEKALRDAKVTDERCWKAIKVKRQWLKGKATDDELFAAWSVAKSAAKSSAWFAAEFAAWSVAELSSARSSAWSSAKFAAWSAAKSAAESVAELSSARSSARSSAWSSAWSAMNKKLERMAMNAKKVEA